MDLSKGNFFLCCFFMDTFLIFFLHFFYVFFWQDSGIKADLAFCVVAFFFLSFFFQFLVTILSFFKSGYASIFASQEPDDISFTELLKKNNNNPSIDQMNYWCSQMLAFNLIRFLEYSLSGSLVLFTIALVAGIMDIDLLMCIYTLAFTCMLLGLVAEFAMRSMVVMKVVERRFLPLMKTNGKNEIGKAQEITAIITDQLRYIFWISHPLAWICIALPW